MECPNCRYPVPAEWSLCRRCGAPLHSEPEQTRVALPPTLVRRRSLKGGSGVATAPSSTATPSAVAAPALRRSQPDTLLPGAWTRPDNLLPRSSPSTPARRARARTYRRPVLVGVGVCVVIALGSVAVLSAVSSSGTTSATASAGQQLRATGLLRTAIRGAETLFAQHHSFAKVSPSVLSARSQHIGVVGATTDARAGEVSMRVTGNVLTLASPANARSCVFARDEPENSETLFVTARTADCRAASPPAGGWQPR